jgi:hypothetical protein
VKKIIFWGDGLLAGPTGYAELLAHHIFLHHPQADVSTSFYGDEHATWQDAFSLTPLHVIGKAPDLVVFGFGGTDLSAGKSPEEIRDLAQSALTLILHKTQSRVCLISMISSFFPQGAGREDCHAVNLKLRELATDRVSWVDLESKVEGFLDLHRQGPGEKHALHLDNARLTPLGRLFLAHHAFDLIAWPDFAPTFAPDLDSPKYLRA